MWTKIEKHIFTQWQSCAVTLSPLSRDINICHEVFKIKTNQTFAVSHYCAFVSHRQLTK